MAGAEAPVLLLHGYLQIRPCWHHIAPELACHHTVICLGLQSYGDSSKPSGLPDLPHHAHPATALDISLNLKSFERTDMAFAEACYHWFLMLQPTPWPKEMLAGQVLFNILSRVGWKKPDLGPFSDQAVGKYVGCFADPAAIHASREGYCAAGAIGLAHDRADLAAGRVLKMPFFALWGKASAIASLLGYLTDWLEVAANAAAEALPCLSLRAFHSRGSAARNAGRDQDLLC